MATTTPEQHFGTFSHEHGRRLLAELTAGSTSEALAGTCGVVLAIIGLAGMAPMYMMTIGVIVIGAAFLMEGAALMARYAEVTEFTTDRVELGSGISAQLIGGAAGIILGILALIGVAPQILSSVAILVFGGCLMLGTGMTRHSKAVRTSSLTGEQRMAAAREVAVVMSGAEALVALAAVVMGILAVVNIAAMSLTLVGVLILGASFAFSGSAMACPWMNGFRETH